MGRLPSTPRPRDRSLIALHSAIRYAVTGHSSHAGNADALLLDFESEAPAQSMEDLGYSCQAYALAYDLIRSDLTGERQMQIEKDLFDYALPLFGASRGWRSNMTGSSVISAGLGMAGLAVSYEPYIAAACEVMDKTLETQLVGGLHQSGPGPGSAAMDSAVNFFYGLKNAGRADYYSHVSFRKYLDTTLQMLSPVGTLPLFGDTSLDQSARLSAFFLKTANQLPDETGRQCIAAYNRYWAHGRYHAGGWIKWILPPLQSAMMFFKNPYLLLQYTREISPSFLRSPSAILGDGQLAVLRTGEGPDSAYLALNMTRSNYATHKDILTFDMYAYRSLLLNGPGFPGTEHPGYRESAQTAASNSITLNGEDQSATRCTGIESSLINQPTFDYLQALADKTYDYGHVRRDIIMARPEKDHPVYFLLFDDVFVSDHATTVQWYLHGRGKLATGIAQISRWTAAGFDPPQTVAESHHPGSLLSNRDPGKSGKNVRCDVLAGFAAKSNFRRHDNRMDGIQAILQRPGAPQTRRAANENRSARKRLVSYWNHRLGQPWQARYSSHSRSSQACQRIYNRAGPATVLPCSFNGLRPGVPVQFAFPYKLETCDRIPERSPRRIPEFPSRHADRDSYAGNQSGRPFPPR